METQDGFIVGVYNYCDRWCERCPFTGRCRVFADVQEMEFSLSQGRSFDRQAGEAVEPRPASAPGETKAAEQEGAEPTLVDLAAAAAEDGSIDLELQRRARALSFRLMEWSGGAEMPADLELREAMETVVHYGIFIGPKVRRAVATPVYLDEDDDPVQGDANGSAKAALLGLERLQSAWLRLAEAGLIPAVDAEPVVTEIAWAIERIQLVFPRVREFVRPGFDEPAAVAWLEWQERG